MDLREESKLAAFLWKWAPRVWPWIGATVSSVVGVWAIAVTQALSTYAPYSYVLAASLGFILFFAALAFMAWLRAGWYRANFYRLSTLQRSRINPLEQSFSKERIALMDLVNPADPFIRNKTFVDCELIGPANAILSNCGFIEGLHIPGCDLIELVGQQGMSLGNAIFVDSCTFRRCKFLRVTLLVNGHTADMIDQVTNHESVWLSRLKPPTPK